MLNSELLPDTALPNRNSKATSRTRPIWKRSGVATKAT